MFEHILGAQKKYLKFQKSWTLEIQILKLIVCYRNIKSFKFQWSVGFI